MSHRSETVAVIAALMLVQDAASEIDATLRHVGGGSDLLGWPEACERALDLLELAETAIGRRGVRGSSEEAP